MSINVKDSLGVQIIIELNKLSQINLFEMDNFQRKEYLSFLLTKYKDLYESSKLCDDCDANILNKAVPVFFLAYFGEPVKDHINLVMNIYRNLFSKYITKFKNHRSRDTLTEKSKLKILFYSDRLSNHSSVLRDRLNVITYLTDHHEIHVMTKPELDPMGEHLKSRIKPENYHTFFPTVQQNIEFVLNQDYDVIIYPDLHMSDQASTISLFRLAPYQFSTWGHSETTGTVDGYFINDMYDVQSMLDFHYTEPVLFVQKSMGTIYAKPINKESLTKTRADFFIPNGCNLYVTTSSLFKMGKEMFFIYNEILRIDSHGFIVIVKLNNEKIDKDFYLQLNQHVDPEHLTRIRFIDRLNGFDAVNLVMLADVYLESYPFGNLNTSLECFAVGTPVITLPTNKMNGRFTQAFYNMMGIKKYIARDIINYINIAVDTGINGKKADREMLELRSSLLWDNTNAGKEWLEVLNNYCRGKHCDVTVYETFDHLLVNQQENALSDEIMELDRLINERVIKKRKIDIKPKILT